MMATYRGVPYEAGVGPSSAEVVLFAACPPPEELGFEPAAGHWRKRVIRAEVDELWESRPVGLYQGEPCLVLDDLGDRLHIAYLGTDPGRAARLGYWQVDRGVFELLVLRQDVTGLSEQRVELPFHRVPPWPGSGSGISQRHQNPAPAPGLDGALPPVPDGTRRSGRRQRASAREIFCELADLAGIPRAAYALGAEVEGAICVLPAPEGFEVFLAAGGARHEARTFSDEEAACFYLFGILAADAVRSGLLVPAGGSQGQGPEPASPEPGPG
jgi:hypothetical protein